MAGLVHGPETRPDIARKQNRNYRSVVRTVPGNFLLTYTVLETIMEREREQEEKQYSDPGLLIHYDSEVVHFALSLKVRRHHKA